MDLFDGEKSEGETPNVDEKGKVDRDEMKNEGETPKEQGKPDTTGGKKGGGEKSTKVNKRGKRGKKSNPQNSIRLQEAEAFREYITGMNSEFLIGQIYMYLSHFLF